MPKEFQTDHSRKSDSVAASTMGSNSVSKSAAIQYMKDERPLAGQQVNLQQLTANHSARSTPAMAQLEPVSSMAAQQDHSTKSNSNGLPEPLRAGIENLSGVAMGDVKVNYNSSSPAQLQAHAYAQGNEIHLGPGQEKHLPHEAWHVVQQKQGRVKATAQAKGGVAINDDQSLEREADVMGAKAVQMKSGKKSLSPGHSKSPRQQKVINLMPLQRMIIQFTGNPTQRDWTAQDYSWKDESDNAKTTIVGKEMVAYLNPHKMVKGEEAGMNATQDDMMAAIRRRLSLAKKKSGYVVKGHLLNDHVGGPASDKNLFPISKGANGDHLRYVENKVKQKIKKKEGVYYKVVVEGAAKLENETNHFRTTVADWDFNKAQDPANTSNPEVRKVTSYLPKGNINKLKATNNVTDGSDNALDPKKDKYKADNKGLIAPDTSIGKLDGSTSEIVIFTAASGTSDHIRLTWDGTKNKNTVNSENLGTNFVINEFTMDDNRTGELKGKAFKNNKIVQSKDYTFSILKKRSINYGGYIELTSDADNYELQMFKMSPVFLDYLEIAQDGLYGEGIVKTSIPFISNADINITLAGDQILLRKVFKANEVDLPQPFSITETNLAIEAGPEGLTASGNLHFGIENIGTGFIKANADFEELFFHGEFNFHSSLFDEAKLELDSKDGNIAGSGRLKIGGNKVYGLKNATANVEYGKDGLRADGEAQPSIPGFIGGLKLTYEDGAFTIAGWGKYRNKMLSGDFNLGFTNKEVDEASSHPGSMTNNRFTPFGNAELTINLTKNVAGKAGAKLLRNGEIEMEGSVGLAQPQELFSKKSINYNLIDQDAIEVLLYGFGLAGYNIGVVGFVGIKSDFFASIGPGTIKTLKVHVVYNPQQEQKTKVLGKAGFDIPANAGLKIDVPVGLKLTAQVASLEGRLDLGGEFVADAGAFANADVSWTPSTGFSLSAEAGANLSPKFKLNLDAIVGVSALGMGKEWKYKVFQKEFGPQVPFEVKFPLEYAERKPFNITKEDADVKEPKIDGAEMGNSAGEQVFVDENLNEITATKSDELTILSNKSSNQLIIVPWGEGTIFKEVDNVSPELSKHFYVSNVAFSEKDGGRVSGHLFDKSFIKKIEGVAFELAKTQRLPAGGYIDSASVLKALEGRVIAGEAGSVDLQTAEFDDSGMQVQGKLILNEQLKHFLNDADIDFVIDNDELGFRKKFDIKSINVPAPLRIDESTIELFTEGNTINARGHVKFSTEGYGTGKMEATYGSDDGFKLTGEFKLDKSIAKDSMLNVTLANGVFNGEGEATVDNPWLKNGKVSAQIARRQLEIGGSLELANGFLGVKNGKVEVKISRNEGVNKLNYSGEAEPNLPGFNGKLAIEGVDKAIVLSAENNFQWGELEGPNVKFGITNQGVDKNGNLNGKAGDKLRAFGGGKMTVALSPLIQVKGSAHILPNAQIEVGGAVQLVRAITLFEQKTSKAGPWHEPEVKYPIYAIPLWGYNIGIEAVIKAGIEATSKVGPGRIEELAAIIRYNPQQKSKNTLHGKAKMIFPSNADFRVHVNGSLGTNLVIASAHGGLEIGGSLPVNVPITTQATVGYFGDKGFIIDASIEALAQTKFRVDAKLISEISVLLSTAKWDYVLKEFDVGSSFKVGVKFPFKYDAKQGLKLPLRDIEFIKPNIDYKSLFGLVAEDTMDKKHANTKEHQD